MSDFERTILARANELQQQYRAEQSAKEMKQLAIQAEAERLDAGLKISMEIGMQAVGLLISHNVKSRTVWNKKMVGKRDVPAFGSRGVYTREIEALDWSEQGEGWEIYRVNHTDGGGTHSSAIALQDDGRLFEIGGRGVSPAIGSETKDKRGGLAVARYMDMYMMNSVLESNEFANGLAHRVSGWGIYTVNTENHTN